ncbi:MAG: D-aminoacyl-tRNA deacylase [Anaerococcus sp.]|nr:D-aminoacyl-tRNA deacylase [Anaerococcus sp.]
MRAVIQKVENSQVSVEGEVISKISKGFMVLLAIKDTDTKEDLEYIKRKIANLRIFEDEDGKLNLSLKDVGGEILLISQFTLYGDVRKGNRPSFTQSAKASKADEYYRLMIEELEKEGLNVKTGKFQTHMKVSLINDGPVTILLDSERIL